MSSTEDAAQSDATKPISDTGHIAKTKKRKAKDEIVFTVAPDGAFGKCGFCGGIDNQVPCDYYDNCALFVCAECERSTILCFNHGTVQNNENCCANISDKKMDCSHEEYCKKVEKVSEKEFKRMVDDTQCWNASPVRLKYIVESDNFDEEMEKLFADKCEDEIIATGKAREVDILCLQDAPDDVDVSHDGVFLGFIGDCEGCGRRQLGTISGD